MPRIREHKWEAYAEDTLRRYDRDRPQLLAVDTETTGLTWQHTPFGMSVSWHGPERIESGWFELEEEAPLEMAKKILFDHAHGGMWLESTDPLLEPMGVDQVFVFYNAKFDLRMLVNYGMLDSPTDIRYIDVMPAVALLEPTGEHKLKVSARKYLGVNTYEDAAVKQARKELGLKKDDGYWPLPREVVVPYALKDTEFTLRLHDKLMPMVAERGLQVAFDKEMRIVAEFLRMEMRGMRVNLELLKDEIKVTDFNLSAARAQIEGLVGRKVGKTKRRVKVPNGTSEKTGKPLFKTVEIPDDLNLDSPKQVLDVFAERGVKLKSTDSKSLERIDDPLAESLLGYRSETKLRQFQTALLKETDENGIVHPNLNSNGTATGRASSGSVKES